MTMTLDFKTRHAGGTSVLVFDADGVQVSLGAWTVITIDGLSFEFDRDAFDWTIARFQGPTPSDSWTLIHEALSMAASLATPSTFRRMMDLIRSSYRDGVRHGEQCKLEQIRGVLGL